MTRTPLRKRFSPKRNSNHDFVEAKYLITNICRHLDLNEKALKSRTRQRNIVEPRQMIASILCEIYAGKLDLRAIAELLGLTNHATIIHSEKTIKNLCSTDKKIMEKYVYYRGVAMTYVTPDLNVNYIAQY